MYNAQTTLYATFQFFDSETGRTLYSVLGQSRPLLSLCALPSDDRFVFAGTDNGILHSVWMRRVEVMLFVLLVVPKLLFTNAKSQPKDIGCT